MFTSCISSVKPPQRVLLQNEAVQFIKSTDAYIGFAQHEAIPYKYSNISSLTAGIGLIPGLISVLIDTGINSSNLHKQNNDFVKNIGDVFSDYYLELSFTEKIKLDLESIDWLHINEVVKMSSDLQNTQRINYSLSKSSSVLIITSKYSFSHDFNKIIIDSIVKLYPKDENLKPFAYSWSDVEKNLIYDGNCIYKNTVTKEIGLVQEVSSKAEAIESWGNNKAILVREAIESGSREIIDLIVSDLKNS
jgi:hypothetical protein